MSRPTLEVADIVRAAGNRFWEHHGSHLAWQHRKVLDAIVRCRTAALGGHRDQRTLRPSGYLIQLMTKQALSPIPGQRTLPVATRAHSGAVAGLLPSQLLDAS